MVRKRSKFLALVLAVVALVAAGATVLLVGDTDPVTSGLATETRPRAASEQVEAGTPAAAGDPRSLELFKRGDPIVWVKKGERVEVRTEPGGEVARRADRRTEFGSPTVFAVERVEGRWAGVLTPYLENDQLGWIRLDPRRLRSGFTSNTAVVDLSSREASLMREGRILRRFPVTVGAPGTTTPVGRFAVTDTFKGDLSPAYGCCAVAITAKQPTLPSGWLGGNRIAFHGTSGPLGEALSHGCIRAADADVEALLSELPLGSRVEVRE